MCTSMFLQHQEMTSCSHYQGCVKTGTVVAGNLPRTDVDQKLASTYAKTHNMPLYIQTSARVWTMPSTASSEEFSVG